MATALSLSMYDMNMNGEPLVMIRISASLKGALDNQWYINISLQFPNLERNKWKLPVGGSAGTTSQSYFNGKNCINTDMPFHESLLLPNMVLKTKMELEHAQNFPFRLSIFRFQLFTVEGVWMVPFLVMTPGVRSPWDKGRILLIF